MAETEHGHAEAHGAEHMHLPDPSPWPFVAGIAALSIALAIVWWSGDHNEQLAGIALGGAAAALFFAIIGWAWEDSGMLRKAKAGGGHGPREARYTQVVTFAIPEGRLDEARSGVVTALEDTLETYRDLAGFLDLRIIASPAEAGPAQVLVETTWAGRDELEGYQASRSSVLDVINEHPDDFLPGTVQAFDMQVVRDTKDVAFRFSTSAAAIVVVGLAVGGFVLAAGLSAFQSEAEVVAGDGGGGGGPVGFDGVIETDNTEFLIDRFEVPPATEITLTLANLEAVPHNISIFDSATPGDGEHLPGCTDGCTDLGGANPVDFVQTPLLPGPVEHPFTFTTPDAEGEYGFWCDAHTNEMRGTMVVVEGAPVPGGAAPGGDGNGGGGTGGFDGNLVARDILWETESFEVLPGTEVTLTVDNQDAGIPHNIAIFAGPERSGDVLTGCTEGCADDGVRTPIEPGISQQSFTFTTPDAEGEYGYICDVHPTTMVGTMIVTAGAGFP